MGERSLRGGVGVLTAELEGRASARADGGKRWEVFKKDGRRAWFWTRRQGGTSEVCNPGSGLPGRDRIGRRQDTVRCCSIEPCKIVRAKVHCVGDPTSRYKGAHKIGLKNGASRWIVGQMLHRAEARPAAARRQNGAVQTDGRDQNVGDYEEERG